MFVAIRCASSRVRKSGLRIAGRIFLLKVLVSAFVFTNIAKFSRAFDEPALSSCSFFASRSLIAKAVDFSARHLGCFAFGTLAELTGGGSVSSRFFIHEN
jgi:hypothetical protein